MPAVLEYLPYRLNDGTAVGDHPQMTLVRRPRLRRRARRHPRHRRVRRRLHGRVHRSRSRPTASRCIAWIAAQPWCTGRGRDDGLLVERVQQPAGRGAAAAGAEGDRLVLRVRRPLRRRRPLPRRARDPDGHGALVDLHARLAGAAAGPAGRRRPLARDVARAARAGARGSSTGSPTSAATATGGTGSVRDDYARIQCPVLCVGGWTDGYTDAALRLMEGLDVPRHALIGPWGHNDPVHGVPGPAVGILGELVRWWDRWLKGVDTGIDDEPMVVAYMQDSVVPRANLAERPGRCVAEDGVAVAADRAARARARRRHARRSGARRRHALGRQRPDRRARRRRVVRRRSLGRSSARPAGRGRALAHLHVGAARRAARDPRVPRGAARRRVRSSAGARLGSALRGAAGRHIAARDARTAQPLPPRRRTSSPRRWSPARRST